MNLTLREVLDRYGPTLALISAIVVLTVLTSTVKGRGGGSSSVATGAGSSQAAGAGTGDISGAGTQGAAGTAGPGGVALAASGPGGSAGAAFSGGGALAAASGPSATNCRPDGRTNGISLHQPPCVAWRPGTDNGGATARGVTANQIVVAVLNPEQTYNESPAANAALSTTGLSARPAQTRYVREARRRYFNNHTETYGREVVFKEVNYDGSWLDAATERAWVKKVATETGAFAVLADVMLARQEAAAYHLLSFSSPWAVTDQASADAGGYFTGRYMTYETEFRTWAEFICNQLAGRPARWSGDPLLQRTTRKFGIIYPDNNGIDVKSSINNVLAPALASRCGVQLAKAVGMDQDDVVNGQQEAPNIMAQMKGANVTTILGFFSFLQGTFLTKAADQNGYLPEWAMSGLNSSDEAVLMRTWSQSQAAHAFDLSEGEMFPPNNLTDEFNREIRLGWPEQYGANSGSGLNTLALSQWDEWHRLFDGIQLAGPRLTPDTWLQGLQKMPKSGGTFFSPLEYYTPGTGMESYKDMTYRWYDGTNHCADELGQQGLGCWVFINGGARVAPGAFPLGEPPYFVPASASLAKDHPIVWPDSLGFTPPGKRCLSCLGP
jgi:hypothetical protein